MEEKQVQRMTWAEVEQRVSRDDERKHDLMMDATALALDGGTLRLPERLGDVAGVGHVGRYLELTDRAETQLCGRADVPTAYYRRVAKTDRGLADRLLNHGLSQLTLKRR